MLVQPFTFKTSIMTTLLTNSNFSNNLFSVHYFLPIQSLVLVPAILWVGYEFVYTPDITDLICYYFVTRMLLKMPVSSYLLIFQKKPRFCLYSSNFDSVFHYQLLNELSTIGFSTIPFRRLLNIPAPEYMHS